MDGDRLPAIRKWKMFIVEGVGECSSFFFFSWRMLTY